MRRYITVSPRVGVLVALAGLVGLTAGCGSGGSSSGSGQLTVLMADAPPAGVKAVNVTVTAVDVHSGGSNSSGQDTGSWKTVFTGSQSFDLLTLANVQNPDALPHIVDRGKLPAGHYTQLRLIIDPSNATITLADGSVHPLVVPSGGNSGLKALPFDIASQQDTVLLLDFDVAQSINVQGDGTYKLTPVIRVAPMTLTGSVVGNVVDQASSTPVAAQVDLKDAGGNVVATTFTTVSNPPAAGDGGFAIHGVASGTYTLEVSAPSHTTATPTVNVTAPDTTDAGSVPLAAGP